LSGNLNVPPHVSLGVADSFNVSEPDNATPMLPVKVLDFGFAYAVGRRKYDFQPGSKDTVVFQELLDPDFALETLGFYDPSNGYIRRF
jgi:hypothetical protein